MPSRPGLSANLALAGAALLVAALIAEAGLRLTGGARSPGHLLLKSNVPPVFLDCYPSNPRGSFDVDLRDPATRARYQALFRRPLEREARLTPFGVETRFNSLHFRGPEPPPKRPGVFRVAVLGDSFTEGQGVREADTLPRRLAERLEALEPGRFEVLNAAHRGADFPQLVDILERQVLPLEPDLVVYAMVPNDAEQTPAFGARYPYLNDWILQGSREPSPGSPWRPWLVDFVTARFEARRIDRDSVRWYLDMYRDPNREGWQATQNDIRTLDRRTREGQARFLLALWPLLAGFPSDYPFAPIHETLATFCDSAGIPMHDLLPALRVQPAESLWVHPIDHHPNEIALRLAAESLAPAVRELALAPAP